MRNPLNRRSKHRNDSLHAEVATEKQTGDNKLKLQEMGPDLAKKQEKEKDPHAHLGDYVDKQIIMQKLYVSERTLQRWRTMGTIPFVRLGRKFMYYIHDIIDLLRNKRHRNDPNAPKKDQSKKNKPKK